MKKLPLTRTALSTWVSGGLLCVFSLYVLTGWLLQRPEMIRILPEWPLMVVNTALCLLLGGLSLLLAPLRKLKAIQILRGLLLVCMSILSGMIFLENCFDIDLGIDQADLHRVFQTSAAHPGRSLLLTSFGFLLFGIAALLDLYSKKAFLKTAVRWITFLVFFIGLFGLTGNLLDFASLFPDFFRLTGLWGMGLHVAVGVMALSLGLWGQWYYPYLRDTSKDNADVRRIYHSTIFVICAIGVATGITGLTFQQTEIKNLQRSNMIMLERERTTLWDTVLKNRTQRAIVASEQQAVFDAVKVLDSKPENRASWAYLQGIGQKLLSNGFTHISIEMHGKRQRLAGSEYDPQAFSLALANSQGASLAWHDGFFLRLVYAIKDPVTGRTYGSFVTEQTLEALDYSQTDTRRWGRTGEMVVCGHASGDRLKCFPHRTAPQPFETANTYQGQLLPMAYALRNESGVKFTTDYRGRRVIASYGPIGSTGLGLVAKIELTEILTPTRQRMQQVLPAMLAMMLLGLWLIRQRVNPLVQKQVRLRDEAEQERANFVAATRSSPDTFMILESCKNKAGQIIDFKFLYLNNNSQKAFRDDTADVKGTLFLEKFPKRKDFFEKYKKVAETGQPYDEEFSWGFRGKSSKWINMQIMHMPNGVAVTWRDLTGKRSSERLLEESNRLRKAIVDSAPYAIVSVNMDGVIQTFNQAAEQMLGYRAEEVIGVQTPAIFHVAAEVVAAAEALSQELGETIKPGRDVFLIKARQGLSEEREWTYVRKDGSQLPVRLTMTAIHDTENQIVGYLGVAYDISEQKRTAEYMRHVALHDVLTGLPNRALLDDRLHLALQTGERTGQAFAVVLLDIDRFKQINDTLGHAVGDQVLIEFVKRLKTCVRPSDTFARMGGDEFVMVLPGCDAEGVSLILDRVGEVLIEPMCFEGSDLQVTSSIGASIFPHHGRDQTTLMRHADAAMYVVKQRGRNGYRIYSPEMELKPKSA